MPQPVKFLVVDDHAIVRYGLVQMLAAEPGVTIAGEASDGLEAIEKAVRLSPDVIIMDIYMPRCSGLEAARTIKEKLPEVKVIFLTVSERKEDLFRALNSGASGYILKGAPMPEVLEAIRATLSGESVLSPKMTTRLVNDFLQKDQEEVRLSSREKEVLRLLGDGLTNGEIAGNLFIGLSTVRTHLQRLQKKLNLRNRGEIIAYVNRGRVGAG
jgi:DNA-binding NarL/FixJ family response regulator